MSQSEQNTESEANIDLAEVMNRFYDRYPRLSRVLSSFRTNPLSGNTLRVMFRGDDEVTRDKQQIPTLPAPVMWQENAPIVISHYASYASNAFTKYWNTTLPDIQKQYGESVRYEHHDVPCPTKSLTEYKLATAGRAIQNHCGTDAFWLWMNTIMVDGVQSMTEAYELADQLEIDIEKEVLKDAVELDLYGNVIWNDIQDLMGRQPEQDMGKLEQKLEDGEPVFAVFVNGHQVQPAYDSIIGGVENIRASQNL